MAANKFSFFLAILLYLATSEFCVASPNFILILADDQGWNGTSISMSRDRNDARSDFFQTPNLERLAHRGMRFTQGYSPAALCSPTRRSIQFGQTPTRQGQERFAANYPTTTKKLTIPRALKAVNPAYRAAHFGKWDLRTDLLPEHLGYDVSDGNTGNGDGNRGSNFSKIDKWLKHKTLEDPKQIFGITRRATDFIEEQVAAGRPFFIQVSHYAVHADTQTRPESLATHQGREKGKVHHRAAFAGMTSDLDAGVGLLLDKLDELGIADSTYVIYTADNGAVPWMPPNKPKHFGHPSQFKDVSRNHPLRGGKWTLLEGGIRVPLIVSGPGVAAESFCEIPVVGWDFLPTIADLAGYRAALPPDLDGGSFRDVLENEGHGSVSRPTPALVFHRYSAGYPHTAIHSGGYKLIKFWKRPPFNNDTNRQGAGKYSDTLLFDLKNDLGELESQTEELPKKVRHLEGILMRYLQDVSAEVSK